MKSKILLVICLLLYIRDTSIGQEVYFIDTTYPVHYLDPHLLGVHDMHSEYSIDDIKNNSIHNFQPVDSLVLRRSLRGSKLLDYRGAYWAKIKVVTNGDLENWTLHFEDDNIGNNAWLKGNGKVDIYAFRKNELYFHKKSGTKYALSDQDDREYWNLDKINFNIPKRDTISLFIRLEANESGVDPFFNVTIRHPKFQFYHPFINKTSFLNTLMLGIAFIIWVYHLFQFYYTRERIYIGFLIWLLLFMIVFGMVVGPSAQFILGPFVGWRFAIWIFIASFVFTSFWFFGLEFVETKRKYPKLDIVIKIFLALTVLEAFYMGYLAARGISVRYASVSTHYQNISIFSIFGAVFSILLILKKDSYAKYFGWSALIGNIGFIFGGLWAAGIIFFPIDPFAITFLSLMISFSISLGYRQQQVYLAQDQQKLSNQEVSLEVERMTDLDQLKSKFFANISHEFRTPLSLILSPIDQVAKRQKPVEKRFVTIPKSTYNLIHRNAERLQSLVENLLDLSRLESGYVSLELQQGGIVKFIDKVSNNIRKAFTPNLIFDPYPEIDYAYYDAEKLQSILHNVMIYVQKNALTDKPILLSVNHKEGKLYIKITFINSNPENLLSEQVFEKLYFQEGTEVEGSGIEMALVKELMKLHNGTISFGSIKEEAVELNIALPISLELLPEAIRTIVDEDKSLRRMHQFTSIEDFNKVPPISEHQETQQVLIVEDNDDLRNYIKSILDTTYHVLTAVDGMDGLDSALEELPDLIISDVMMPKMDGYTLCEKLKTDPLTNHIPVILLTAKAGQDNQLKGLKHGADAYMSKPFSSEELLVRVRNLIEVKQNIADKFSQSILSQVSDIKLSQIDNDFLSKISSVVKENLDNEQFSVEDLAETVGFSRSQLHRKLKSLIDKSANQLIIEVRLNEAKRMLENKVGTISEIAYMVGYSSLPYFTKSFKKQFGILPSKVIKNG